MSDVGDAFLSAAKKKLTFHFAGPILIVLHHESAPVDFQAGRGQFHPQDSVIRSNAGTQMVSSFFLLYDVIQNQSFSARIGH